MILLSFNITQYFMGELFQIYSTTQKNNNLHVFITIIWNIKIYLFKNTTIFLLTPSLDFNIPQIFHGELFLIFPF